MDTQHQHLTTGSYGWKTVRRTFSYILSLLAWSGLVIGLLWLLALVYRPAGVFFELVLVPR